MLMVTGVEKGSEYPFAIQFSDKSNKRQTSLSLPSVGKQKDSYGAMPVVDHKKGNASKRF